MPKVTEIETTRAWRKPTGENHKTTEMSKTMGTEQKRAEKEREEEKQKTKQKTENEQERAN